MYLRAPTLGRSWRANNWIRMAAQSRRSSRPSAPVRPVAKVVPQRRTFILLETGLLLGLFEGLLWNLITRLSLSPYLKAAILMIGVVGLFALAVRILEPVIAWVLKMIASLDRGSGAIVLIGVHAIVLFLIYVGYLRVFFKGA